MGTRSAVCEPHGYSYRGRYVHWDGYPSCRGVDLLTLVRRDGLEKVRQTIIHDHYGWSTLRPDQTVSSPELLAAVQEKKDTHHSRGECWAPDYGTPEYHAYSFLSGHNDGRFVQVEGYGVAYTTHDGQSSPDDWVTPGEHYDTEWRYILADDGIWVLEGYGPNPQHITTVPYNADASVMEHVEEQVYRRHANEEQAG